MDAHTFDAAQPAPVLLPSRGSRFGPPRASRAMTRCECAGVSFEEVARRMDEHGLSLAEVTRATGCAGNCTACKPDLDRFLAARGLSETTD